jgi:hypothetical protein
MMRRWRAWFVASWLAATLAGGLEGCTTSPDAGGGAGVVVDESGTAPIPATGEEAGPPAAPDSGPPDDPVCGAYAGSDPYCAAVHGKCRECSSSMKACDVANLATCGKTSAAYSEAARSAAVACMAPGCPVSGDEDCLRSRLAAAPRTAAQQELVTAFCASCDLGAGAAACAARFFFRTPDGGTSKGLGPGARVMMVNDSLVGKIESSCISQLAGAGDACENVFFYCANQALSGAFPSNACRDAGK